ncbi:hypothetical protein BC2230_90236 [Burkholderia cepacia]
MRILADGAGTIQSYMNREVWGVGLGRWNLSKPRLARAFDRGSCRCLPGACSRRDF